MYFFARLLELWLRYDEAIPETVADFQSLTPNYLI